MRLVVGCLRQYLPLHLTLANLFCILFAGDNGRIKYSIEAGDDSNDFEILQNGTILTKNLLDRESKSGYNLIVRATDCAPELEKRLSTTVQVSHM